MHKDEFFNYLLDNFTLSGEAQRLIYNILSYVELNASDDEDAHYMLNMFFDDTIGITEEEIAKYKVQE